MINLVKNISWIAGGQIISLLSNFVLLKILTSNLSTSSFGYYSLWMSVALFFRQVIYDPVSIVAAKESVKGDFLGVRGVSGFQIVSYIADLILKTLLLLMLISIIIEFQFSNFNQFYGFLAAGIIYLVSNGAQGIYINMLNANKKRKFAALGVVADSLIKLFFIAGAIFLFEKNYANTIQSIALSSFLVYLGLRYFINQMFAPADLTSKELNTIVKQLLVLSLPFLMPCLLVALKTAGDKWLMAGLLGVDELAAYSILLQLGFLPMILFIGVIQTFVAPEIYRLADVKHKFDKKTFLNYVNLLMARIFIFSFVAVITSVFLSKYIFNLLIGPNYINYSGLLPIFVGAGSITAVSGVLHVALVGALKAATVAWLMLVTVAVGLVISVFAISIYGFYGGVAGLVVSNFFSMFVYYTYLYKYPWLSE